MIKLVDTRLTTIQFPDPFSSRSFHLSYFLENPCQSTKMGGLSYASGGATAGLAVVGLCKSRQQLLIRLEANVALQICSSQAVGKLSMYIETNPTQ